MARHRPASREDSDTWADYVARVREEPLAKGSDKAPPVTCCRNLLQAAEVARTRFRASLEQLAKTDREAHRCTCRREHRAYTDPWPKIQFEKYAQYVWYRGDKDWPEGRKLLPGVFREDLYPRKKNGERSPEKWMLREFCDQAPLRHERAPDTRRQDLWLSLAQHYGLPTRLLDWTGSILAAGLFATEETEERRNRHSARIWALAPALMNRIMHNDGPLFVLRGEWVKAAFEGSTVSEIMQKQSQARLWERVCRGLPDINAAVWAVSPIQMHARMVAQQAGFTAHASAEADLSKADRNGDFLMHFNIPWYCRKTILMELRELGISRSVLFPDLENLAKDITERWKRIVRDANKDP